MRVAILLFGSMLLPVQFCPPDSALTALLVLLLATPFQWPSRNVFALPCVVEWQVKHSELFSYTSHDELPQ